MITRTRPHWPGPSLVGGLFVVISFEMFMFACSDSEDPPYAIYGRRLDYDYGRRNGPKRLQNEADRRTVLPTCPRTRRLLGRAHGITVQYSQAGTVPSRHGFFLPTPVVLF